MKVIPIKALKDNYIWCLIYEENKAILIDPGEAGPALSFLRGHNLQLTAILITHHHYDHTAGIPELLANQQVPVYGSTKIPMVDHPVADNEILKIPGIAAGFLVIAVPGHTLDHVAYYHAGMAFTGDTLFTAGCGKIFEGTAHQMYDALFKLKQLPDDTLIYCGHEYTENNLRFALRVEPENSEIRERLIKTQQQRKEDLPTVPAPLWLERQTNPFLRLDNVQVIQSASSYYKKPLTDPVMILKALREWKNQIG